MLQEDPIPGFLARARALSTNLSQWYIPQSSTVSSVAGAAASTVSSLVSAIGAALAKTPLKGETAKAVLQETYIRGSGFTFRFFAFPSSTPCPTLLQEKSWLSLLNICGVVGVGCGETVLHLQGRRLRSRQ